jgi:molecular chaperone DnaK (HSP70)
MPFHLTFYRYYKDLFAKMAKYPENDWNFNVNYAVGIDLGTTYSCVAVFQDNRVKIATDENGHKLIPSAVAFVPRRNGVQKCVGHEALEYYANPEFLVTGRYGRSSSKHSKLSCMNKKERFQILAVSQKN